MGSTSNPQGKTLIGRWVLEANSGKIYWSEQIKSILGIYTNVDTTEDIIKRLIKPEDQDRLRNYLSDLGNDVKPGNVNNLEIEIVRPDNSNRTLLISVDKSCSAYSSHRIAGYVQDITQNKLHEAELKESENKWRSLTQNTPDIIMHVDLNGRILFINYPLPEHTVDGVVQMTLFDFLPRDQQVDIERCLNYVKQSGQPDSFYVDFPDPQGNMRHFEGYVSALKEGAETKSLIIAARDITDRRKAENQMLKLSRALANTADTVLITDKEGIIEYLNTSFEKLTGYKNQELIGKNVSMLAANNEDDFYDNFLKNIETKSVYAGISIEKRKDGEMFHVQKTVTALKNNVGETTHYVSIGKDITDYMLAQEKLQHMATHDMLTQLPNRSLYYDRLEQALARAHWHDRLIAVLFVDIDRFKYVNDTLGHEIGDRLLQKISRRLQSSIREGDTVARLGGDEFAILLDDVASEEDVSKLAQKFIDSLKPDFNVDGHRLHVTASIGVSLYPNDGNQPSVLLKNADMAMYRAKVLGKNNFQYYSEDLSARAFERLNLENSLRTAIIENQLEIFYQPQFDYIDNKIIGIEALLRWNHPELGTILPTEFIHLLEETSLIIEVGNWVLQRACRQLKYWHKLGHDDMVININFSSRQFSEHDLVETIETVLDKEDLDSRFLQMEITESLLINDVKHVADSLNKLSQIGVKLALDDFGTGYSSLSYLKRFPIYTLKIDRSFIHDICKNKNDAQITKAIIAMGKMLDLKVIAEGVETEAQLKILLENDCNIIQGYLFREPRTADSITEFLEELSVVY